jgi:hypothetical protein
MGYKQTRPTWIAQDNAACIYLVKGAGMYINNVDPLVSGFGQIYLTVQYI